MKNSRLSNVRWGRVLLTGIVVYTLSYCIIFLVITAYGFILAFQARGAPDQDQIQQFASQVSPWGVPALALLLTFGAAVWVSRKVIIATSLHGLLVGLIVAIISVIVSLIFGWAMNLLDLMWFFLIIAAGWFSGFLYSRGR
jgi:hypothetical protein